MHEREFKPSPMPSRGIRGIAMDLYRAGLVSFQVADQVWWIGRRRGLDVDYIAAETAKARKAWLSQLVTTAREESGRYMHEPL